MPYFTRHEAIANPSALNALSIALRVSALQPVLLEDAGFRCN